MKAVAITPEEIVDDEARVIATLIDEGWWRVHLRHPRASAEECAEIIAGLSPRQRASVSVHDHYDTLSRLFPEIGLHINSRQSGSNLQPFHGKISRSCHTIAEALSAAEDYVTLSPIFDSVSKPGYLSAYTDEELRRLDGSRREIIALGGITPERIPLLADFNFSGFAMLGAIPWHGHEEIKTFSKKILTLC